MYSFVYSGEYRRAGPALEAGGQKGDCQGQHYLEQGLLLNDEKKNLLLHYYTDLIVKN